MKRKLFIALFILMVAVLTACNDDGKKEDGLALLKTTNPAPMSVKKDSKKEQDLIHSIEKDIEEFDEIYDVAVLKGKEDVLVAYKVKHMQRFYMKRIEKEMLDLLEKKYPDENFTVSSDYKIFLEAVELEENMKDPDYSTKKAEKKLKEIIRLKKELT